MYHEQKRPPHPDDSQPGGFFFTREQFPDEWPEVYSRPQPEPPSSVLTKLINFSIIVLSMLFTLVLVVGLPWQDFVIAVAMFSGACFFMAVFETLGKIIALEILSKAIKTDHTAEETALLLHIESMLAAILEQQGVCPSCLQQQEDPDGFGGNPYSQATAEQQFFTTLYLVFKSKEEIEQFLKEHFDPEFLKERFGLDIE